eukprot:7224989-Karenia_brevis.AAC.1
MGTPAANVVRAIMEYYSLLPYMKVSTFGYVHHQDRWVLTADSKSSRRMAYALDYFVRNVLNYTHVHAVRVGRGVARFNARPSASHTVLLWWKNDLKDIE